MDSCNSVSISNNKNNNVIVLLLYTYKFISHRKNRKKPVKDDEFINIVLDVTCIGNPLAPYYVSRPNDVTIYIIIYAAEISPFGLS